MDSQSIWWTIAVASSLVSGVAVVGLFVARRPLEPVAAITIVASGAVSAAALARIGELYQRGDAVFYALALVLAGFAGGYALASTMLFRLARPLAPIELPSTTPDLDPRPAVILTCCIEPPAYDLRATAGMLQSLTDEGVIELSVGGLPFLFFAHKARYRSVDDTSPSQEQLAELAERLTASLSDLGVPVDWASCSGATRLGTRVASAAARGHRTIVIAEVSVARSGHAEAARTEVDALRPESHGLTVLDADSALLSDRVCEMVASRILADAVDPASAGVVLVGHGQPEERARRTPWFEESETVFLSRIRVLLTERGIANDRVRIAWSEWMEPDITSQVRHLAAQGCSTVIVTPAAFPLDTLATRIDIGMAARQARVDDTAHVVVQTAWGPDPELVAELDSLVRAALTA